MARLPQRSIPQQAQSWAATLATYRLLHNERVTPEAIQHGVVERARQACARSSVVLCLHDLTQLKPVQGLTPTKLLQHTVLAVAGDASAEIHGLLHQRWLHDPRTPPGELVSQRRQRWTRSQVWPEAVESIGPAPGRWIDVADREADDFQMFHACRQAGHGFIIRSQHDRGVVGGGHLREMVQRQPVQGGLFVQVPRRSRVGDKAPPLRRRAAQPARCARLEVRFSSVVLRRPRFDPRYQEDLPVHVVQVRELDPPADVEKPIDWLLLTTEPVQSLEDALTVVDWYAKRWRIEEFHKAQKTGCHLEQTQVQDCDAFIRLAAIASPVAVRLLQLREKADDPTTASEPAMAHMDPLWVQVVSRLAQHPDAATLTMRQFHQTVARQGGWLGRRGDGRPGWQSLWHGWQIIANYVEGIRLLQDNPPDT